MKTVAMITSMNMGFMTRYCYFWILQFVTDSKEPVLYNVVCLSFIDQNFGFNVQFGGIGPLSGHAGGVGELSLLLPFLDADSPPPPTN